MAELISGKTLAAKLKAEAAAEAAELREKGVHARLAVVIVGENPASRTYVAGKAKDCAECGLLSDVIALPEETTEAALLEKIAALNADKTVHGVLVQLPLPGHIREKRVIDAISPDKDVDGFTPVNVGRMVIGEECFLPCTPAGCIEMLKSTGVPIAGKDAVVIGRSNIVGKPAALLLTANNATVTLCHTGTKDVRDHMRRADVIVAAMGVAGFVKPEDIKEGSILVDVGVSRVFDEESGRYKVKGDVDKACYEKALAYTPNPGGVGPMTRAMLLQNVVEMAERQL